MIPLLYRLFDDTLAGGPARLLHYTTVRAIGAFLLAFALVYLFAPRVIASLFRRGFRDRIRDYGEVFSQTKSGTPTMGGLLIVGAVAVSGIVFADLRSRFVPLLLLTTLWFGFTGFLDDLLKIRRGGSDGGLSRSAKLLLQCGFSAFFALLLLSDGTSPLPEAVRTRLFLPCFSKVSFAPGPEGTLLPVYSAFPDLGLLILPVMVAAMVIIANAINFADGLDGLAILPSCFTAIVFGAFAYVLGHTEYSSFLFLQHLPGANEVAVYASALVGAGVGFAWFNAYPAQIIMGDTGSEALGGTIAALAILTRQELLFLVAGAVFVFEFVSVLIQDRIGIAKVGRRYFYRTPIHHTYQFRGVAEPKVVVRFWIAGAISALLSLATLKLR